LSRDKGAPLFERVCIPLPERRLDSYPHELSPCVDVIRGAAHPYTQRLLAEIS
jgi:ABC-type dipeptide/oligopeptide/nickel transport system ATPase component